MADKNKILIIEDDDFLKFLCAEKLTTTGFNVLGATSGEEGLEKAKTEKPDLILLDVILGGMDGFEVLKQLKEDPVTASIPVFFLSNLGQEDDIVKGKALGADDYLVKASLTTGEISEKIKKALGVSA